MSSILASYFKPLNKMKISCFLLYAIICVTFFSCKKNDISARDSDIIQKARRYFDKAMVSGPADRLQRSVLWDKSRLSKSNPQFMIAPLKFAKKLSFSSPLIPGLKRPAELDSKLIIYEDDRGELHFRVYNFIPDSSSLNRTSAHFSGLVESENWDGTNVTGIRVGGGKYRKLHLGETAQTGFTRTNAVTVCYYLNVHNCEVDNFGNLYDCILISSTFLGCEDVDGEEYDWINNDPGAGGGGDPVIEFEDDFFIPCTTSEVWEIQSVPNQIGGGSLKEDIFFKAYLHFNKPQKDKFDYANQTNLRVTGNSISNAISVSNGTHFTNVTAQNVSLGCGGRITFPSSAFFDFSGTNSYNIGDLQFVCRR